VVCLTASGEVEESLLHPDSAPHRNVAARQTRIAVLMLLASFNELDGEYRTERRRDDKERKGGGDRHARENRVPCG